MASRSLGTLTLDLVAKTGGFREGMTAAERQAEKTNQKIRKETAETIDTIAEFGAKTVMVAAAVGAALAAMGVQAINEIDRQAKLAKQLGATVDELNLVARAADLSGVEFEQLSLNMKRFNDTIGEAQKGNKTAIETIAKLGTTAEEVSRMSLPDRIELLSKAMEGLNTQSERATLAQDLFGKAGQEMLPLLTEQGESLKRAADEMKRFGLEISQADSARIEAAADDISSVTFAMKGLGNQLAVSFAPVVSVFSEKILEATKDTKGFGSAVLTSFEVVAKGLAYVANIVDVIGLGFKGLQVTIYGVAAAFYSLDAAAAKYTNTSADVAATRKKSADDAVAEYKRVGAEMVAWAKSDLPSEAVAKFFDEVRARAAETPVVMPVVDLSYNQQGAAPTVGGTAAAPEGGTEIVDFQTALDEQSSVLEQYRATQVAADQFVHDQKMSMLADELATETATAESTAEAWSRVTDAKQKEYQKNADFFQKGLDSIARGNSKASKVARALNLADSLYDIYLQTKVAAINAFSFGSKLGGPVLGGIFAGTAIAFGASMASEAIAGSRGGGGVPSAGVTTTPEAAGMADGQATAGRQSAPVEVTIVGKGLPSWEQVAEIMNMVGERMADSGNRMGKVTILTA